MREASQQQNDERAALTESANALNPSHTVIPTLD